MLEPTTRRRTSTQRAVPKSGCVPTVQILLQRISGFQIRRILNPLDYHLWGAMLDAYQLQTNPKTIAGLKEALQLIWDNLPQGWINKAVKDFSKRLKACVEAGDEHIKYSK